jgi:hypothetical protein
MTERIRMFLAIEVVVFVVAALIHFGVPIDGHEDAAAGIAESVIALVLLAGLALSWLRPDGTRAAGIAAQGFALLGTCVGFTLVLVVGPTKVLDVTFHSIMLALLVSGLAIAVGFARDGRALAVRDAK